MQFTVRIVSVMATPSTTLAATHPAAYPIAYASCSHPPSPPSIAISARSFSATTPYSLTSNMVHLLKRVSSLAAHGARRDLLPRVGTDRTIGTTRRTRRMREGRGFRSAHDTDAAFDSRTR